MSFDAKINSAFSKGIMPFEKATGVVKAIASKDTREQELTKDRINVDKEEEITL